MLIQILQALLEGPCTGVPRGVHAYRDLILTPIVLKVPRGARSKKLKKEFEAQKIVEKWEGSSWAKRRQAREARRALSDFGRFEVQMLKKRRAEPIKKEVCAAKKAS